MTTPQVIIAGVSLLIYFSATLAGAIVFVINRISAGDEKITTKLDLYHEENRNRINAMQTLLIRHDVLLSPEFNNGHGYPVARANNVAS
jgi:hypothetical protein